jgi:hypothetical protein
VRGFPKKIFCNIMKFPKSKMRASCPPPISFRGVFSLASLSLGLIDWMGDACCALPARGVLKQEGGEWRSFFLSKMKNDCESFFHFFETSSNGDVRQLGA